MASTLERCTQWIMKQVFEGSLGELSSKNPIVLTCGGVYIPHPESQRMMIDILVTPNHREPVKVMMGPMRRNALHEMLIKGSMN